MAVRLREADNIAAMAELQQQISELEIQVKLWLRLLRPSAPSQTTKHMYQLYSAAEGSVWHSKVQ